MVRPIRIPQRDVGGGAPPVLPSIAAQAAPALAAGRLALQASGVVVGAAKDHIRKQDNLTRVREQGEFETVLSAGVAALDSRLGDYVQSDEYNESDYRDMREEGIRKVFADAGANVTHKELRASAEGRLEGMLRGDLTAELEGNAKVREVMGVEHVSATVIDILSRIPADAVPAAVNAFAANVDRTLEENPEMLPQIQAERKRVFRAAKAAYPSGVMGELQFQIDIDNGELDSLGLDIIAPARDGAAERRASLTAEIARDAFSDDEYGVAVDSGGQFKGFDNSPNVKELEALLVGLEPMAPSLEMERLMTDLGKAIRRRERAAKNMKQVVAFNNGELERLPGNLTTNPSLRSAWNHHFAQEVSQWLSDPRTSREDKQQYLTRSIARLGVAPEALKTWMQATVASATINDADTLMAVAIATRVFNGNPVQGVSVTTSRERLAAQEGQLAHVPLGDVFDEEQEALLDHMSRMPSHNAASAYISAVNAAQARESSSGQSLIPELSTRAGRKAADAQEKGFAKIQKELEDIHGGKIQDLGARTKADIQNQISAKVQQLIHESGLSIDDAVKSGTEQAYKEYLEANPPVTILGRTSLSSPLHEATKGYPPEMPELELVSYYQELGFADPGDMPQRSRFVHSIGMKPGEFEVMIETDGKWDYVQHPTAEQRIARGLPDTEDAAQGRARILIDGETSVLHLGDEALEVIGMQEEAVKLGKDGVEEMRSELVDAAFMDKQTYRRFGSAFRGAPDRSPSNFIDPFGTHARTPAPPFTAPDTRPVHMFHDVEDGDPLWSKRQDLKDAWQKGYDDSVKARIKKDAPLFSLGPLDVRRSQPFTTAQTKAEAIKNADDHVRLLIEKNTKGSTIPEFVRFLRTGLWPNESGPGLPLGGSE